MSAINKDSFRLNLWAYQNSIQTKASRRVKRSLRKTDRQEAKKLVRQKTNEGEI